MTSESHAQYDTVRAVAWGQGRLHLLDQRRLPTEVTYLEPRDAEETAAAIEAMVVRGAPAIGLAAAYGLVLEAEDYRDSSPAVWWSAMERAIERLANARPTALHLHWALDRMRSVAEAHQGDPEALRREAERLHAEDIANNYRMAELGAAEIAPCAGVLTHCNTGSLATAGYGTALGVIRTAWAQGRIGHAYVAETRPWRQGTRLTLWELLRDGIPASAVVDGAAAHLMATGAVQWVIVGADRIAANGDVANKIGTYALAIAARHHGVGMMVVAPSATIDPALASGAEIPIEQRGADEILEDWQGSEASTPGPSAHNPVFDVTPAGLVDLLVTERGCVHQPDAAGIAWLRQAEGTSPAGALE